MTIAAHAAVSRYQELDLGGRVGGADAHGLVALLYDELGIALDVLGRAEERGQNDLARRQRVRCATLLSALQNGLDLRSGPLAVSLAGIYAQMQRRLSAGGSVDEVRDGVRELAAAWAAIIR